jgi:protein-tyrosine-phosphatase
LFFSPLSSKKISLFLLPSCLVFCSHIKYSYIKLYCYKFDWRIIDTDLSTVQSPDFLKLLAHDLRWKILTLLAHSDYQGQEFIRLLGQPQNLVSYHLRKLHAQHLVTEHRSTADERSIYYSLDLETVRALYQRTGMALHPALGLSEEPTSLSLAQHSEPPRHVLFLCTENSARSQMAEALLRHLTHGQIQVSSAGSYPSSVHPLALRLLAAQGIETGALRSKSLEEFVGQHFDLIVTVCDRVRESCPSFPSDPDCIHWSLADPAAVGGSLEEQYQAFEHTFLQLRTRLRYLLIFLERARRR